MEGKFATGPVAHTMVAGFDWQKTQWTFLRQAAAVSPAAIAINVYDPVYTHYDFEPTLAPQMSTRETDSRYGVYLQDQIALDRWRFTLGGRQDWTRMDSLNRLTGTRQVTRDEAFTGRAGVTYLFDNGLAPYFSYSGRSSRPAERRVRAAPSSPPPASSGRRASSTNRAPLTA